MSPNQQIIPINVEKYIRCCIVILSLTTHVELRKLRRQVSNAFPFIERFASLFEILRPAVPQAELRIWRGFDNFTIQFVSNGYAGERVSLINRMQIVLPGFLSS